MNHVYAELLPWFQELPAWQNEVFRRLLGKAALTPDDIAELYQVASDELGLNPEPKPPAAKLQMAELPAAAAAGNTTGRLVALHSLQGVNRLAPGHRLEFGPQLTIVYGGNGTGKSGYARVLKDACRCNEHAVEPILNDVYSAGGVSAQGMFDLESNHVPRSVGWKKNQPGDLELKKYAVFDSKAARGYLNQRNNLPLTPSVFIRLENFGEAVKLIKERLNLAAQAEQPAGNALEGFVDSTTYGKAIAGISAETNANKLGDSLVWTDSDQSLLEEQDRQLTHLKANGPVALRKTLQESRARLQTLGAKLLAAENLMADAVIVAIKECSTRRQTLKEQKSAAAQLALGHAEIPGIGSAGWEALIKAAAAFFHANNPGVEFPGVAHGVQCMLCCQVLPDDARNRLKRFWTFLQDDASKKLELEIKKLEALLLPLKNLAATLPPEIAALETQLATDSPVIWPQVAGHFVALVATRDSVLQATESNDWTKLFAVPAALSAVCIAQVAGLLESEKTLSDPETAAKDLQERQAKIAEMRCRKKATTARAVILAHHQKLVRSKALRTAASSISTTGISAKASGLQKKHLLDAFAKDVQDLAKELGLRRAVPDINSKSTAGKVSQAVVVKGAVVNASLESVFSEGERTALALAYFLAELGDPQATLGVIFDDPVTSLDHNIRQGVVNKITALGKQRQVIVFTHDLPFFSELAESASHASLTVDRRSIEAVGPTVGVVRAGAPWDAMSVAERESVLDKLLATAKTSENRGDPEAFHATCGQFYGRLRATWERAVEELVFNKVVLRFDKRVKTQSLKGVVVEVKIIEQIFAAMTKCSASIEAHDHAAAANVAPPDTIQMQADLAELKTFRGDQKKRIAAQENTLGHLK